MHSEKTHYCPDLGSLQSVANSIALNLVSGDIVTLQGNLGAGKTTLVRTILETLGYRGKIKSPTFSLVESYNIGKQFYYHFDLYRIHHPTELYAIGFEEYINQDNICFIEWPEKARIKIPGNWEITIKKIENDAREITIFRYDR